MYVEFSIGLGDVLVILAWYICSDNFVKLSVVEIYIDDHVKDIHIDWIVWVSRVDDWDKFWRKGVEELGIGCLGEGSKVIHLVCR